jgi:glycosyltransferase involved in cell wall biosynthesis
MKILYSVQRYGEEIVGGSETACRLFAENLAARGHEVTVLTSCALNYVDWSNHFPPGDSVVNGVRIKRLPVAHQRDSAKFSELHSNILRHVQTATTAEQIKWLDAMGPVLKNQSSELRRLASNIDVAVFMTYLYPTSVFGLPTLAGDVPTVLQPTAHDEPPAHLPIYRNLFHTADSFLFLTEEEKESVKRIHHVEPHGCVTGIGMNLDQEKRDGFAFRQRLGLGDDPYLIYVGRIDTFKGVSELMRYFVEFKGRNPSRLRLVLAGQQMMDLPDVDDIRQVGFLSDEEKADAIAGSVALVQPSPFESFSIVLCESWLQSRPVLVQGYSEVLTGQARRSQGGLPYNGFAEFEECLLQLMNRPELASELGANGYQYVFDNYSWDVVLNRFEEGVHIARSRFAERFRK